MIIRHVAFGVIAVGLLASAARGQSTSSSPSSQPVDEKLWAEMAAIDARAGKIADVRADFEQRKFTPLLKKPLISSGRVLGKGTATIWITEKPEPTKMLVDAKEIRIYYPKQGVMEIYPIEGQLGALASSPLPRLEVLKRFFAFERTAAASLDPSASDDRFLALRMPPIVAALREYVVEVKVLLNRETGFIERAENVDADGDRTVLTFLNVRVDTGMKDEEMRMDMPAGTRIVKPLEGMGQGGSP